MQSLSQAAPPDLQSVRLAFTQWRNSGTSKRRTPEHLQRQSAALISQHSKSEICRALKIPYGTLNRWITRFEHPQPAAPENFDEPAGSQGSAEFIALPLGTVEHPSSNPFDAAVDPQQTRLHITLANGTRLCADMSISQLLHILHSPGCGSVEQGGR